MNDEINNSNLDILSLHETIIKKKNKENTSCLHENNKLENENWGHIKKELEFVSSKDILNNIEKNYIKKTSELKENFEFYLLAALPILNEFKSTRDNLTKISFFRKNKQSDKDDIDKLKKLIASYLKIINDFFPHENFIFDSQNYNKNKPLSYNNKTNNNYCKLCKNQLNIVAFDNQICCKQCGNVTSFMSDNLISFRDIERISIGSKYTYDRKQHFKETIKRFQGICCSTIPELVFESIKNKLVQYKIIPFNYETLDKTFAFRKVKKSHIRMILKELGLNKYNEDIIYIYKKITEHDIPDLKTIESVILNDFDQLLEVYDEYYSKTDRKNFLSNNYTLYQILHRHGIKVKKEDFPCILKTTDRKIYHDNVFQVLFQKLGWNFTPLF